MQLLERLSGELVAVTEESWGSFDEIKEIKDFHRGVSELCIAVENLTKAFHGLGSLKKDAVLWAWRQMDAKYGIVKGLSETVLTTIEHAIPILKAINLIPGLRDSELSGIEWFIEFCIEQAVSALNLIWKGLPAIPYPSTELVLQLGEVADVVSIT